MSVLLAYCGLDCAACEAYQATATNNQVELARIATEWAKEFGAASMSVADVTCTGCADEDPRKCSWCSECPLRACACPCPG